MPTDAEEGSPNQQDALIAHVEALVRASGSRLLEAVQAAAVAGERSTRQRLDAIFAQLEALLSLRHIVPLELGLA